MKSLSVSANDANQRLDKFLLKTFPDLPVSVLYKGIRTKHIKVNRKRAQIDQRLIKGDAVDLYLDDALLRTAEPAYDFMRAGKTLSILYEDAQILLLEKPAGLLCHADGREYTDTLVERVKRYLFEKGEYDPAAEQSFAPALANRIDRNTGGIVMAAKTAEALRVLGQKIKDREIRKAYLCLVHGVPDPPQALLTGYLTKDEARNRVTVYPSPVENGRKIETRYQTLAVKQNRSLLRVELLTGRTHQIRAHLAFAGYPLVGDPKYGRPADRAAGLRHQALYSYQVTFAFTTDGGCLAHLNGRTFEAAHVPFAQDFTQDLR